MKKVLKPKGISPAAVRARWAAPKAQPPALGIGRKAARPPAAVIPPARPPASQAPVRPKSRSFVPPGISIVDAMDDQDLFAGLLEGPSWEPWRTFMTALWGLPLDAEQLKTFRHHTGRKTAPTQPFRSATLVCGRRGGKSRVLALIAVYLATVIDHRPYLVPGETPVVAVIAADRKQARVILNYIVGTLRYVPALAALIKDEAAESVQLSNGVSIEVQTGSIGAPRGRTYIAVLADETAFWSTDGDSANPDVEIINAVRPGLSSIPYSLLLVASSPYAKRGILYTNYSKYFGRDDAPQLVWQGTTIEMNATLIRDELIEEMYREDPERAAAEFGASFRSDIVQFITRDAVEAVLALGVRELPPSTGISYAGFVDASGGSADSFTLGIAYMAEDGTAILAAIREVKPPFSPDDVTKEFSVLLKSYGITRVTGDAYAGEWPRERFAVHGIGYDVSKKTASMIYSEFLPALNGKRIQLLDLPRLIGQAVGLERSTQRGTREKITHAPGGHDDVVNAAAGALVQVLADRRPALVQQRDVMQGELPHPVPDIVDMIFAVLATTKEGETATIYLALLPPITPVRLLMVDFETAPLRADLFGSILERLKFLQSQVRVRRPGLAVWTTEELAAQAARGGYYPLFQALPKEVELSERLMLSAANHISAGKVKVGPAAHLRGQTSPLGAALDLKGGDKADNPLRVATLWGIEAALGVD